MFIEMRVYTKLSILIKGKFECSDFCLFNTHQSLYKQCIDLFWLYIYMYCYILGLRTVQVIISMLCMDFIYFKLQWLILYCLELVQTPYIKLYYIEIIGKCTCLSILHNRATEFQ